MNPTLRVGLGFFLALIISWFVYPRVIEYLKKLQMNQTASDYALDEFKEKPVTPTLGGTVFVVVSVIVSFLVNGLNLMDTAYNLCLLAFVGYAAIGLMDDLKIIREGKNEGLSPKTKIVLQIIIAAIFYYFYRDIADSNIRLFPTETFIDLGIFYGVLVFLMFVATTNAVNITDGMDGLSGGTSFIALSAFLVFALVEKQWSIAVLVSSLMGSLIGYLRVNFKPAKIIMGDTGSLALGGIMAALAMVLKIELLLVIIGGVFVWETATVILQVASVKLTGKRIFKYTPIHYSFIISGYKEESIVIMFYLVGFVLAIIAIALGLI